MTADRCKEILQKLGYPTDKAGLASFQKNNDLVPTGALDDATAAALEARLAEAGENQIPWYIFLTTLTGTVLIGVGLWKLFVPSESKKSVAPSESKKPLPPPEPVGREYRSFYAARIPPPPVAVRAPVPQRELRPPVPSLPSLPAPRQPAGTILSGEAPAASEPQTTVREPELAMGEGAPPTVVAEPRIYRGGRASVSQLVSIENEAKAMAANDFAKAPNDFGGDTSSPRYRRRIDFYRNAILRREGIR
jgi:hypothetical protein